MYMSARLVNLFAAIHTPIAARRGVAAGVLIVALLVPAAALAQTGQQPPPPPGSSAYQPITAGERLTWMIEGVASPRSLGVGVLTASWFTGLNAPKEWGQSWSGFGKRYLEREADVGMANAIEAGLGAIWGEDPRYRRSQRSGIWARIGDAAAATALSPRQDGRLRPGWARFAGKTLTTQISNRWLPPSATTKTATTVRVMNGFVGRFAGNLWQEFWPDVRAAIGK
jgi:hypothetical protein